MRDDAETPSEEAQVEGVESALLAGVECLDLATIEQRAEHAGLVHLHLVADRQHVVPRPSFRDLLLLLLLCHLFSSLSRERLLKMAEPR